MDAIGIGVVPLTEVEPFATPELMQAFIKERLLEIVAEHKPGDEVRPHAVLVATDVVVVVDIAPLMGNDGTKDVAALLLRALCRDKPDCYAVALITEAWVGRHVEANPPSPEELASFMRGEMPDGMPRPSEDPEREEVVMIQMEFAGHAPRLIFAAIESKEGGRALGDFQDQPNMSTSGRFGDGFLPDERHGPKGEA